MSQQPPGSLGTGLLLLLKTEHHRPVAAMRLPLKFPLKES